MRSTDRAAIWGLREQQVDAAASVLRSLFAPQEANTRAWSKLGEAAREEWRSAVIYVVHALNDNGAKPTPLFRDDTYALAMDVGGIVGDEQYLKHYIATKLRQTADLYDPPKENTSNGNTDQPEQSSNPRIFVE